jgi:hypothetical protein
MSPPPKITRRTITIGGAVAVGAAILAGGILEIPKLIKRRSRGHYADLVNLLNDPEQAAIVGKVIHFNSIEGDTLPDGRTLAEISAVDLRSRLAKKTLSDLMIDDSDDPARVVEAGGWIIPMALAEICVLAAQSV